MTRRADGAIGIFDSGVGGLSVWREIAGQLPGEDTLYVADQVHMPYGSRSLDEARILSEGVSRYLIGQGAKLIVVACNSASAAALHHLRRVFPQVPFVGMEPAVKPAVERTRRGVVGVIATQATFQGTLFASLVEQYGAHAEVLTRVGRGLARAVESGALDTPETESLLRDCLGPLVEARIDHLVLGCTHYPFLLPLVERVVGTEVTIIDPAPAVARQVGRVLSQTGLANRATGPARHRFFTSGDELRFANMLELLLPGRRDAARPEGIDWEAGELLKRNSPPHPSMCPDPADYAAATVGRLVPKPK